MRRFRVVHTESSPEDKARAELSARIRQIVREWKEGGFERHVAHMRETGTPTNMILPSDCQ